jgi:predicted nuclease with TOPRIM domain
LYRDIQEIQHNNRRLLRKVHQLEAEVEKKVEHKTQEKMQEVYKRLEHLKGERGQITEKLQVVMRQRDMFKAIADLRQSSVPSDPAIPDAASDSPARRSAMQVLFPAGLPVLMIGH